MMFLGVGETFMACTLVANTACVIRKRDKNLFVASPSSAIQTIGSPRKFEPIDMSDFVVADIQSVPGVKCVKVERAGNSLRVNIGMRDLEYETCKKVYAKELDLYMAFPALDFDFNLEHA